tara:strand:- start:693 stop:986 length:294 start_codon:yes stop_codon:yes gene_type:complete
MKTYTVIKYVTIQTIVNNQNINFRVYMDDTEVSFSEYQNAIDYRDYLISVKLLTEEVEFYEKEIKGSGELDLESFIFEEVKKKLTEQEFLAITKNGY